MPQKMKMPMRRRRPMSERYPVDPQDPRQSQAGFPHPPASDEQAMIEDRMASPNDPWKQRYINRSPDLNQPVPRAGAADFDRQRAMADDFAKRMAMQGPPKLSALRNLRSHLTRRRERK